MAEPKLYHWDFDRNPWDSRSEATAFSVGLYQWLPKASGKGLKKSNTIRVQGYVADSESVYANARDLCHRLNADKVHWGKFPDWVQKSYSVSKPPGFVVKRQSPGLSGAQARVIRKRAVKEHLLPAGFIQSHARLCLKTQEIADRTSDPGRRPTGDQQGCTDTNSRTSNGPLSKTFCPSVPPKPDASPPTRA